jgi:hypothetical protein
MKSRLFAIIFYTQSSLGSASFLRFDSDAVVDSVFQPLSAPEVLFRCLHAHMPEQKLDLLKLPTHDVAEPGTRAAQVMWGQLCNFCLRGALLHNRPDDLFSHPASPNGAALIHAAKNSATGNTGALHSCVQDRFDPVRHGDCTDMPSLADEVDDGVVILPFLQALDRKMRQFRAASPQARQTARMARLRFPLTNV